MNMRNSKASKMWTSGFLKLAYYSRVPSIWISRYIDYFRRQTGKIRAFLSHYYEKLAKWTISGWNRRVHINKTRRLLTAGALRAAGSGAGVEPGGRRGGAAPGTGPGHPDQGTAPEPGPAEPAALQGCLRGIRHRRQGLPVRQVTGAGRRRGTVPSRHPNHCHLSCRTECSFAARTSKAAIVFISRQGARLLPGTGTEIGGSDYERRCLRSANRPSTWKS